MFQNDSLNDSLSFPPSVRMHPGTGHSGGYTGSTTHHDGDVEHIMPDEETGSEFGGMKVVEGFRGYWVRVQMG